MKEERFNKKKKRITILILAILLFGISVGYATLSTSLSIDGSSEISANTWDIHWDNIKVRSGSITTVATPATIKPNTTEVEFDVTFHTPGEYYEFTVDAVNAGTIDAMTSVVNNKIYEEDGSTETTLPSYLEYTVTYDDGVTIAQNHLLKAEERETYRVRVYYKRDIEASQLPQTAETYKFAFSVTYVQSDTNGIAKPDPTYLYTINPQASPITLGTSFPTSMTTYSTFDAATQAFEHDFSLRHVIVHNEVMISEVVFEMNGNTYALNGGADESSESTKPIYKKNKKGR